MNSSLGSRVTNVQGLNNHMREILEAYGNYYDEKVLENKISSCN